MKERLPSRSCGLISHMKDFERLDILRAILLRSMSVPLGRH
jgi:hypothetical protein